MTRDTTLGPKKIKSGFVSGIAAKNTSTSCVYIACKDILFRVATSQDLVVCGVLDNLAVVVNK